MNNEKLKTEIVTARAHRWRYETDDFYGTCVIANDQMIIRFTFESKIPTNQFFDVLKIDQLIREKLEAEAVSVEGMADWCADTFSNLKITVSGCAASHGWITSEIE